MRLLRRDVAHGGLEPFVGVVDGCAEEVDGGHGGGMIPSGAAATLGLDNRLDRDLATTGIQLARGALDEMLSI